LAHRYHSLLRFNRVQLDLCLFDRYSPGCEFGRHGHRSRRLINWFRHYQQMGFTSIKAQGMSAPPYIVAYIVAVAIAFLSDRKKTRGIFVAIFGLLGRSPHIYASRRKD
jgi:hypothetical protein